MSRPKHRYDLKSIQNRQQVLAKFGIDSKEMRQADRNWKACSNLCAQTVQDKMVASHGCDTEQGWWYANDGTRIREFV